MKIGIFILILILVFAAAVIFIQLAGYQPKECVSDSDCVPATCCHPDSCTAKANAPNCSGKFCTEECAPKTLDCNGSCSCIKNACVANLNNF
jgi:predicted nucleic acid binding AN1-type Zn finger protein